MIELGAGTGLVGMLAATLGINNDGSCSYTFFSLLFFFFFHCKFSGASCVDITDRNIATAKQNLENNLRNSSCYQHSSVVSYEWGSPIQWPLAPPYDLILGSDVIYIEETFHLLEQSLRSLCTSDTVVLLASKLRYNKVENFLKILEKSFNFHTVDKKDNIFIYMARLKH